MSAIIAEASGTALFLPELSEIFWSGLVIVILGVVFYKLVLPKMNAVLDARADKIEGDIRDAALQKAEAEALYSNYTEEIKRAKHEAGEIKDDARAQASQILQDAHVKAQADAELTARNASRAIESEKKAAETALKKQIGSLAMSLTQKMLSQGLENQDRQSKLIDASIQRFENSLSGESKSGSGSNPRSNSGRRGSDPSKRGSARAASGEAGRSEGDSEHRVRRRIQY